MATNLFVGFVLLANIAAVHGGSYCYTGYSYSTYCSYGCCNYSCCNKTGSIVGASVGSLVALAVIVGVIIAICCCRRRQNRLGQVVTTQGTTTTVVTGGYQQGTTYPVQTAVIPGTYPGYGPGYIQPQPMGYNNVAFQQPPQPPMPQQMAAQPPPQYSAAAAPGAPYEQFNHVNRKDEPPAYEEIR